MADGHDGRIAPEHFERWREVHRYGMRHTRQTKARLARLGDLLNPTPLDEPPTPTVKPWLRKK